MRGSAARCRRQPLLRSRLGFSVVLARRRFGRFDAAWPPHSRGRPASITGDPSQGAEPRWRCVPPGRALGGSNMCRCMFLLLSPLGGAPNRNVDVSSRLLERATLLFRASRAQGKARGLAARSRVHGLRRGGGVPERRLRDLSLQQGLAKVEAYRCPVVPCDAVGRGRICSPANYGPPSTRSPHGPRVPRHHRTCDVP